MNVKESPALDYSWERNSIAAIDRSVHGDQLDVAYENQSVIQANPQYSDAYYDEPTYNNEVSHALTIDVPELDNAVQSYLDGLSYRDELVASMNPVVASLFQPVPDMEYLRAMKSAYRNLPIDQDSEHLNDDIVSLREYGVACRAYYSRPNGATKDPVEGVKPDVFIRRSVAEKLQRLNQALAHPDVTRFFGGEVELAVDEGLRDPRLQKYLYETIIPDLIRNELHQQSEWLGVEDGDEVFEQAINEMRNRKIARPPTSYEDSPSPHATGAAFDLAIRYKQNTLDIVPGVNIPMGRKPAQMSDRTDPDHFEREFPENDEDMIAMQHRRALYALMSGKALVETGFAVNPTEFWHWSDGDQLAALVKGQSVAHYGWPKGIFND